MAIHRVQPHAFKKYLIYIKYAVDSKTLLYALREDDIIIPTSFLHTLFFFTSILYDRAKNQDSAVIDPHNIHQLNQ